VRLYSSYVLRCWSDGDKETRVEVVEIQSLERIQVTSWEAAFQWIQDQESARLRLVPEENESEDEDLYLKVLNKSPLLM
jgi:hypothetical protein